MFFGLKSMSDSSDEVQQILRIMQQKILSCDDALDDIAIGNILFGVRNMSSDCAEVVGILGAVNRFIRQNPSVAPKQIAVISNAAHGLKNCSSDVSEVKEMLSYIAKWFRECEEVPTHAQISSILLGLSSSKDNCNSVLDIIQTAADAINRHKIQLDKQGILFAFKCLQSMRGEAPELIRLVEALKSNILGCEETFTLADIKNIQSSMTNFTSGNKVHSEIAGAILNRNLKL